MGVGAALTGTVVQQHLAAEATSAEISLQADGSSFMLRDTRAEAPAPPEGPAPQTDLDTQPRDEPIAPPPATLEPPLAETVLAVPSVPAPPAALPALEVPPPPEPVAVAVNVQNEIAPVLAEVPAEPGDPSSCVSHQGVSPMLRHWRMFVLATVLATAPAVTPAPAGEGKSVKDQLAEIKEQLSKLRDGLREDFKKVGADIQSLKGEIKDAKMESQLAISTLQRQVNDLKTDLDGLKRRMQSELRLYPAADKDSLDDLRARIAELERTCSRLQGRPRVAMFPPAPVTGRVLLVNTYPYEILFIVNAQSQRVPPGATVTMENVPAGAITYEAIAPFHGVVARTTTTLAAGETLTLTAR
jgi:hypothetical protein